MSFFDSPEYDYSYDKSVSSPLGSLLNSEGEVRRIKENVRPLHGFAPVNKALNRTNNTRKFIYTMRHGKALHNAMSKEYTKPISWRFFPKLVDNFDPSLTPEGFETLNMLANFCESSYKKKTPLYRALRLDQKITLCVKEGLREWKGYDHDHQSDRRNTTPHILSLFNDLKRKLRVNVEIELDGKQDAEDDLIMRETYVDVDRRTREVLDDIFNDDDSTCSMLVLHNRSNKSVMRVMGHIQDEVHKLDKENCAMLGYLMERTLLHPAAAQRRFEIEEENWHSDKMMALEEKQDRYEQAAEDIDDYRRNNVPKLLNLRDYLGLRTLQGDEEALKALVDLYQLAPELKLMARQAVKLGDQAT